MAQSIEGREAHIGAGAELLTVVEEIMHVVEVMDGLNRYRFADDSQLLAAWEAASNVLGPFKKEGEKRAGGQVKPAA